MTNHPDHDPIFAPLRSIRLDEGVKTRMRAELSSFADLHAPAELRTPTLSPFMPWRVLSRTFAVLALMLSLVGGTAYTASAARPGDSLYPLKLTVTEPVQTALIPTTKGRAAWHAVLAERRLEEATRLAAQGKLDAQLGTVITENFALQVESALTLTDQLRDTGQVEEALIVRSDLEARITAHEAIVSVVAASMPDDGTDSEVDRLLASVGERREEVALARMEDEVVVARAEVIASTDAPALPVADTATLMMASAPVEGGAARSAKEARELGVSTILEKHATFLSTFATTTATSTATTTQGEPVEEAEEILP